MEHWRRAPSRLSAKINLVLSRLKVIERDIEDTNFRVERVFLLFGMRYLERLAFLLNKRRRRRK
jgi:hypothetical protein